MFSKETYVKRRAELKKLVKSGVIILFGNNESPVNYPSNGYYPFRQDSSFLYYFGLNRDGLVGVIDIDEDKETLVGDDIDIEDIVWFGSVDSVSDMAACAGVGASAPMKQSATGKSISCRHTGMTRRYRYTTCSAYTPTSRKKRRR